MLCQKCNKNNASIHYQQNINGNKTEYHLCPECAAEMGLDMGAGQILSDSLDGFGNIFSGFFGGSNGFGDLLSGFGSLGSLADSHSEPHTGLKCPDCGMDLSSLGGSSFLGCPECYDTFESILGPNLDRFQRGHRHTGKRPNRLGTAPHAPSVNEAAEANKEKKEPLSEVDKLRAELNEAVKAENYEKAAELRDKIKEIGDK